MCADRNRVERERQQYNAGLKRARYVEIFKHCYAFTNREIDIATAMSAAAGASVLEIGSSAWMGWLEGNRIKADNLHLINISEVELQRGREKVSPDCCNRPQFHLMDAHKLEFPDQTFDVVFGAAILHHLDLQQALAEIHRVLKPGGRIVFLEPYGVNPVAKLVRIITPKARTVDEQPFRLKELDILAKYFECRFIPYQLTAVFLGVVSGLFFADGNNWLMKASARLDRKIAGRWPQIAPFYRQFMVIGMKK